MLPVSQWDLYFTVKYFSVKMFMYPIHFSFIGKGGFRWATLSCDSSYCLSNVQILKHFVTFFSRRVRPTYKLKLGTYNDNGLIYVIYWTLAAGAYISLVFLFSSPGPKTHRWAYSRGRRPSSIRLSSSAVDNVFKRHFLWSHEADSRHNSHIASI